MKSNELVRQIWLAALLVIFSFSLLAQEPKLYKSKPAGHEQNQQLVAKAYEANLKQHANDSNVLVLPGLVADKQKQRIEVMVESTGLDQNSPCEFTIVGEQSDHAYEALLVSLVQPSAIYQALQFIGVKPGAPIDFEALRFWAKGECVELSVVKDHEPPVRLEDLLLDQRTGKTLPQEGFRFTGSKWLIDPNKPGKKMFAADIYDPMAIVSLFNSPYSVLEVPYAAAQSDVYQNTTVNPAHHFAEGGLLTLIIRPVKKEDAKITKDLVLEVSARNLATTNPPSGLARLQNLSFQLKDGATLLNAQSDIGSMLRALDALDRKRNEYYLTVKIGDNVTLGAAQALASILAIMDCERGVRVDAPPPGQLYYRAFTPDRNLLDRDTRLYHPWELTLSEKDGDLSGSLVRLSPIYKGGSTTLEWEVTKARVSTAKELPTELKDHADRLRKSGQSGGPPVIMVFAASNLLYGQLLNFLEPVLPTYKTIQIYLDQPMPPIPEKKP